MKPGLRSTLSLPHRNERGVALAIALLAIVLIGALVTGTFFAGRLEMETGRNAVLSAQATEAAETGLTTAFASWSSTWNTYPTGTDMVQSSGYPTGGKTDVRYTNTIRRLQGGNYLVISRGEKLDASGNVLATRLLAKLGKLITPTIDIKAAVTANADVQVNGHTTKVDGHDQLPSQWTTECPAPAVGSGVYGIRTSQQVGTSGSPDISGVPTDIKINDATITNATFVDPYLTLSPLADIVLTSAGGTNTFQPQPTTTGSPLRCNSGDANNWGEPYRTGGAVSQCITYFPVVLYPGPGVLKLTNGRAQGVILSAGDISIAGNFEFDGILLAMGALTTTGTGNKVTGAALSGNANINDDDTLAGTPTILYSSCAISSALRGSARPVPLTERSWAQVNPR